MQRTRASQAERYHPFKEPDDYVGYRLYDPLEHEIGRVEKLFVNGAGEPEYIRVKIGPFGLKAVLIPVQMVAVDDVRRTIVLR